MKQAIKPSTLLQLVVSHCLSKQVAEMCDYTSAKISQLNVYDGTAVVLVTWLGASIENCVSSASQASRTGEGAHFHAGGVGDYRLNSEWKARRGGECEAMWRRHRAERPACVCPVAAAAAAAIAAYR